MSVRFAAPRSPARACASAFCGSRRDSESPEDGSRKSVKGPERSAASASSRSRPDTHAAVSRAASASSGCVASSR